MGFAMKIGVFFILMAIVFGKTNGTSYKIGDSAGWTNHGVDYKSWAVSKVFHVGDVFLFEYNKEFHNVVRVTHKNFNACNSTSPYKTLNSGYDLFTVRRPGHYYFICGFGDHCRDGQRVDIRVATVQPPTNPPAISPPSNPPTISPPSQAPLVPPSNPPTISPPSNPPSISPPSPGPRVPPSNPPTISPPSPAPHVPPSNSPTISPPSPAPYVPAPVPVEPPLYSPVPAPGGSPDSPVPYAPVPAPANSGSSQYPGIICYTMFLASVLMGICWF